MERLLDERYIIEIGKALADGHAAVMVGAGFSKNAEKVNAEGREFLNWNQLSDLFYESLYGNDDYPGKNYCSSLRIAEEVEIMIGRPGLENLIKQAVPDEDYAPSKIYIELMELPWVDVFTTNYDTLLERAANRVTNRRYNIVVCKEDLVNSSSVPRIIKLHGSFPSQRPFIITEEDYRTYPVKFAPMVNTVQQALLENVFCMIGFSCDDPNFTSWIGWIHDHLSKSSSQKIYMITILSVSETQKKFFFSKNIIVVDLEKLWPNMSILERLQKFLGELKSYVDEKEKQLNWFDLKKELNDQEMSLEQQTEKMHKLRLSYPGSIFLPWNLKGKTSYILNEFTVGKEINDISYEKQLKYMVEYVKFFDLAGRPILLQTAEIFLEKLSSYTIDNSNDTKDDILNQQQIVYLHLMRTYREHGNWEKVEECKRQIKIELLNYNDKQFYYAEECRIHLFLFEADKLIACLKSWNLSEADIYWSIIKAFFYSSIGERKLAEDILVKNLTIVRKQLMKNGNDIYLSSIEESTVSLLNFIRQAEHIGIGEDDYYEKCIHMGSISWWDENSKYSMSLKGEQHVVLPLESKYRYELDKTYSMNF